MDGICWRLKCKNYNPVACFSPACGHVGIRCRVLEAGLLCAQKRLDLQACVWTFQLKKNVPTGAVQGLNKKTVESFMCIAGQHVQLSYFSFSSEGWDIRSGCLPRPETKVLRAALSRGMPIHPTQRSSVNVRLTACWPLLFCFLQ